MRMKEKIRKKLETALHSEKITVHDDSAAHAGHAGARPGGETHFTITAVSGMFAGLPRIKRHRLIYTALEEELSEGVHALAIKALTKEEYSIAACSPDD